MKEWRAEQAVLYEEIAKAERAGQGAARRARQPAPRDVRPHRAHASRRRRRPGRHGRPADRRVLGVPRAPAPAAPLGPAASRRNGVLRELQAHPLLGGRVTAAGRRAEAAAPLVLYFDGASRGNPGPSAYGVWSPSGLEKSDVLGTTTNNVAEWRGFLAALDLALASGAEDVEIRADSQLVLRQFSGEYRMKAPHLADFLEEARRKARGKYGGCASSTCRARRTARRTPSRTARSTPRRGTRGGPGRARDPGGRDRGARRRRARRGSRKPRGAPGARRRPSSSSRSARRIRSTTSSRRTRRASRRSARTASRRRRTKFPHLPAGCAAHLIGPIQSNKANRAARSRRRSRRSTRRTSRGGWTARPRRSESASARSCRCASAGRRRSRASSPPTLRALVAAVRALPNARPPRPHDDSPARRHAAALRGA